jgi:L-lactate dehydrogenase complex protein LldF
MTSSPRQRSDADGPDEMHVILLDNGRVDMLAHGYGEALCCVRCGACLNVCPVYREIGGHAYGSTYSGPIGAVISGLLHNSVTDVKALPYASTLCGACREACPVKIDLPRLLLDLRADVVDEGETARLEKLAMQNFALMMGNRMLYESAGKMASGGSNLLAWFSGGSIKSMPGPFAAWTDTRNFPPFAKHSFRDQWRERQARRKKIRRDE